MHTTFLIGISIVTLPLSLVLLVLWLNARDARNDWKGFAKRLEGYRAEDAAAGREAADIKEVICRQLDEARKLAHVHEERRVAAEKRLQEIQLLSGGVAPDVVYPSPTHMRFPPNPYLAAAEEANRQLFGRLK